MVRYGDYEGEVEELIALELGKIERKTGVRILHAVESGSRSWGFASPDSDYDVRFVYLSPLEHYLSLRPTKKDTIMWVVDETLDIVGWDVSKALHLARKSNVSMFEWAESPIVYRTSDDWTQAWDVAKKYFSCKAGMYAYYGTASATWGEYLGGERVRYKKYLYALRPLLACKYIDELRAQPPVDFHALVDAVAPAELVSSIEQLLTRKATMNEKDTAERIPSIDAFIESSIQKYGAISKALSDDLVEDDSALDDAFRALLNV